MKRTSCRFINIPALILPVILLLVISISVNAAAPSGPLSTEITVEGDETWTTDVTIMNGGKINISGNLVIDGAKVRFGERMDHQGPEEGIVITVRPGASLTFRNGSTLDLSGAGNMETIVAYQNAALTFDTSSITGSVDDPTGTLPSCLIVSHSGNITLNDTTASGIGSDSTLFPYGIFQMEGGALSVNGGSFSDNRIQKPLFDINGAAVSVSETSFESNVYSEKLISIQNSGNTFIKGHFKNNSIVKDSVALINIEKSTAVIGNGSVFEKNEGPISGVIFAKESDLTVEDSVMFSENNEAEYHTDGVIVAINTVLSLNKAEFIGNIVESGMTIGHVGGTLRIDGTVFRNNHAFFGGAVFVGSDLFDEIVKTHVEIKNAVFENNEAIYAGGALCIGPFWNTEKNENITAEIHSAVFKGNRVYQDPEAGPRVFMPYPQMAGGAISISTDAVVTMKNLVVTGNSSNLAGGGIAAAAGSRTVIKDRNGAAIFGNISGATDENVQDIYFQNRDGISAEYTLSDRMCTGGMHHWTAKPAQEPLEGELLGSAPDNTSMAGAMVLMEGNSSARTPLNEQQPFGGGIANRGTLIVGEDPADPISVRKSWDDEGNASGKRPDVKTFLEWLRFSVNEQTWAPENPILFEQQGGTADGTLSSKYYAENDPSVTFQVDENPAEPNTLRITVYGLPQVEEGQTYVISEEPLGYEAEISIDPAEGYLITNHLLPEPTPEPEPEPENNTIEMFRLLRETGVLPQTGFPGELPPTDPEQPQ